MTYLHSQSLATDHAQIVAGAIYAEAMRNPQHDAHVSAYTALIDDTLINIIAGITTLITVAIIAFFWKPIATWILFALIWLHQVGGA